MNFAARFLVNDKDDFADPEGCAVMRIGMTDTFHGTDVVIAAEPLATTAYRPGAYARFRLGS
jgi:hypothetical protein